MPVATRQLSAMQGTMKQELMYDITIVCSWFQSVCVGLVCAMQEALGDDYTDEVKNMWNETLALVAGIMIKGMSGNTDV